MGDEIPVVVGGEDFADECVRVWVGLDGRVAKLVDGVLAGVIAVRPVWAGFVSVVVAVGIGDPLSDWRIDAVGGGT